LYPPAPPPPVDPAPPPATTRYSTLEGATTGLYAVLPAKKESYFFKLVKLEPKLTLVIAIRKLYSHFL
jgi:hypothetical protein